MDATHQTPIAIVESNIAIVGSNITVIGSNIAITQGAIRITTAGKTPPLSGEKKLRRTWSSSINSASLSGIKLPP
ncbi:MAG: hypothetical protein LBS05_00575 [Tannerellaceae bacterium]|nr:hypothetical protein [Tannerellaceae bacterium]